MAILRVKNSAGEWEEIPALVGAKGDSGFSPTVETQHIADTDGRSWTVVTITDAEGSKSFNVYDGEDAGNGGGINAPPSVSVVGATILENGHLMLLMSDGTQFDCGVARGEDGTDGKDGEDGYTPVKGTDYWTEEDKQEIVDEVLENVPAGSPDAVLFTAQELTEAQKAQARANIGAAEVSLDGLEQFDVKNFSGGNLTTREGYYTYRDNGTNFTYTMPYPQQGAVTITFRFERDEAHTGKEAGINFVYNDGTTVSQGNFSPNVTHTIVSDAEKTLTAVKGNWNFEQLVYLDLSVMSVVYEGAGGKFLATTLWAGSLANGGTATLSDDWTNFDFLFCVAGISSSRQYQFTGLFCVAEIQGNDPQLYLSTPFEASGGSIAKYCGMVVGLNSTSTKVISVTSKFAGWSSANLFRVVGIKS